MLVIIPLSSRSLLLWLAASVVCAVILTIEGMAFITLWRRPSRPWRLGMAALALGALAVALAGRILAAYRELPSVSACYSAGCIQWYSWVRDDVIVLAILGGLLIAATCASVVAAIRLSAAESGSRSALMRGAWYRIDRLVSLTLFVLIADAGMHWTVDGIAGLTQFVYLLNSQAAGDGLGQRPFEFAVAETLIGVFVLGLGVSLIWYFTPQLPAQVTAS